MPPGISSLWRSEWSPSACLPCRHSSDAQASSKAPPTDGGLRRRALEVRPIPSQGAHAQDDHSMGGKVAQLMASRRHKGLAGLVLVAPSPPQPMTRPPEAREQMAAAYSTRESVSATIDHVLTAKVLSPTDQEQVIEDSLSSAPPAKVAWPRSTSLE